MSDYVLIICVIGGFLLGICSGLTPGLHTNNFAALLLSLSPSLLSQGIQPQHLAMAILASSISHTFLDIIPAVFIGAPDADTALAVLPGHSLMLEGRAMEAIRLSAIGSATSIIVALMLVYPLTKLVGSFYDIFMSHIGTVLLAIITLMILTEQGQVIEGQGSLVHLKYKLLAVLLFLSSGLLGLLAFEHQDLAISPIGLQPEVLLPLLSGLFGASLLIVSLAYHAQIPPQLETRFDISPNMLAKSTLLGGIAGSVVAWIPGVTPAVATLVTRLGSPASSEEFLVSISGVNTANALFALVALHVIGRSRSGAAAAIKDLVNIDQNILMKMIMIIIVVATLSYFATIWIGGFAAAAIRKVNYRWLCLTVLLGLAGMALMFTGWFGAFLFVLATIVGLIAPLAGIRKTHAMGVLMLPLLVRYL
jgi:putative membrane protein